MRRRRKSLGATNRRGPRTGAIEVPAQDINRVARKLVSHFKPNEDVCQRGDVLPALARVRGFQVRRPDGEVKTVDIEVIPNHLRKSNTGAYLPSYNTVQLLPDATMCATPGRWKEKLYGTLRHELTHVADPRIAPGRGYARKHTTHCDYINDPLEVTARVGEVREQLETSPDFRYTARKGEPITNGDIRISSETYATIERCLTPANKKRFLKTAARVYSLLRSQR